MLSFLVRNFASMNLYSNLLLTSFAFYSNIYSAFGIGPNLSKLELMKNTKRALDFDRMLMEIRRFLFPGFEMSTCLP